MSRPELQRAKADFEQVRAILHDEWDPIGCGVPEDEYDSYAWPVLALLQRGAQRDPRSRPVCAGRRTRTCSAPFLRRGWLWCSIA